MTSLDLTDAARRPFTGRRVRFGDVSLQVVAGAAAAGATVLVGLIVWKVVDGARPAISALRPGLRHAGRLEPGARPRALRRRQLPLRHGDHLALRARPRCAARDGDRALSQRARAARGPGARHGARRDARRDPERRASASGASSSSVRCCARTSNAGCTARSASSRSSATRRRRERASSRRSSSSRS